MDPFVAEIRIFPFNFSPLGWAFCDGQLLPLSQNTALFALVGTMYGGNGRSNFALPNLMGRAPIHSGQGPGLSFREQGETGGQENVTLLTSEIPAHTHQVNVANDSGLQSSPQGALPARSPMYKKVTQAPALATQFASLALQSAGGDQPHNNMQPYLTLNFCIALQGVFPPRS